MRHIAFAILVLLAVACDVHAQSNIEASSVRLREIPPTTFQKATNVGHFSVTDDQIGLTTNALRYHRHINASPDAEIGDNDIFVSVPLDRVTVQIESDPSKLGVLSFTCPASESCISEVINGSPVKMAYAGLYIPASEAEYVLDLLRTSLKDDHADAGTITSGQCGSRGHVNDVFAAARPELDRGLEAFLYCGDNLNSLMSSFRAFADQKLIPQEENLIPDSKTQISACYGDVREAQKFPSSAGKSTDQLVGWGCGWIAGALAERGDHVGALAFGWKACQLYPEMDCRVDQSVYSISGDAAPRQYVAKLAELFIGPCGVSHNPNGCYEQLRDVWTGVDQAKALQYAKLTCQTSVGENDAAADCEAAQMLGAQVDMQAASRQARAREEVREEERAEEHAAVESRNEQLAQSMAQRQAAVDSITHNGNLIAETASQQAAALRAIGERAAQPVVARQATFASSQPSTRADSAQPRSETGDRPPQGLPGSNGSGSITVQFTHSPNWAQGTAHVVSSPAGIDCPDICSASFQSGENVGFAASASPDSIIHDFTCWASASPGTGPETAGNTVACLYPGNFAKAGGPISIRVDLAGSYSGSSPVTGNGLPPRPGSGAATSTSTYANEGGGGPGGGTAPTNTYGTGSAGGGSNTSFFSACQVNGRDVCAAPLPVNCISEFYNKNNYGWYTFQNNYNRTVELLYVPLNATGPSGLSGETSLAPGGTGGPGLGPSEIASMVGGGYSLYVCPSGYTPITQDGRHVQTPGANFTCYPG
jgi:hypothetical protein